MFMQTFAVVFCCNSVLCIIIYVILCFQLPVIYEHCSKIFFLLESNSLLLLVMSLSISTIELKQVLVQVSRLDHLLVCLSLYVILSGRL